MRTLRLLPALALGVLSAAACAKQEASGLTIALGTDLVVPDDINAVAIVLTNAETGSLLAAPLINPTVPSAEGRAVRFPATLALETAFENDGSTFSFRRGARKVSTVQIALVGLKGPTADQAAKDGAAVTLRRVVTSMPESGTHLLRLHLGVLDLGGASGTAATLGQLASGAALVPAGRVQPALTVFGDVQTTCADPEQNLVDGACSAPPVLDGEALPLFDPAQVFGGAPAGSDDRAQCFDIPKCLADATPVVLDADGSVPTAGAKGFALVRAEALTTAGSNAVCLGDGAARRCFAPLDEPELGTTGAYSVDANGVAHFGAGVVAALKSGKIRGLVATSCAKTAGLPICAPWSSVVGTNNRFANDAGPAPDATVDASIDTGIDATIDSGIDSGIDADAAFTDASDASFDAALDAATDAFVPVVSAPILVGGSVNGIVDFVLDPKSKDANARVNGALVVGKNAQGAIDISFVSKASGNNVVTPNWDGEFTSALWPYGRLLRRPNDPDLTQLIAAATVAGQPQLYELSTIRGGAGPVSLTPAGKAVGSFAYTNVFLAGSSLYTVDLGAPAEHFFARTTDLQVLGSPFGNEPPAAILNGASLATAGGEYDVLLGLGTKALYNFHTDTTGLPTAGPTTPAVNGFLVDPPTAMVAPDPPIEQIVAGSPAANANFYVVRRTGPTETTIRAVQPNTAVIGGFGPVVVPTVDWQAAPGEPPPGVAYTVVNNAGILVVAGKNGISLYNATTGAGLGFLLRSAAGDLDVRKIAAESGCIYFALWAGTQLTTRNGALPGGAGLYQVCLQ